MPLLPPSRSSLDSPPIAGPSRTSTSTPCVVSTTVSSSSTASASTSFLRTHILIVDRIASPEGRYLSTHRRILVIGASSYIAHESEVRRCALDRCMVHQCHDMLLLFYLAPCHRSAARFNSRPIAMPYVPAHGTIAHHPDVSSVIINGNRKVGHHPNNKSGRVQSLWSCCPTNSRRHSTLGIGYRTICTSGLVSRLIDGKASTLP